MDAKKILERIDYNESKIKVILEDLKALKAQTYLDGEVDVKKILSDEKYRMCIALKISNNNIEASELLNMSERTFYRKLRKYKLNDY